jgi:hypothetical protein
LKLCWSRRREGEGWKGGTGSFALVGIEEREGREEGVGSFALVDIEEWIVGGTGSFALVGIEETSSIS